MFKFSLRDVLDYREAIEKTRQRAYMESMKGVNQMENEKNELHARIERSRRTLHEGIQRGMSHAYRRLYNQCAVWAETGVKQVEARIARAMVEVEKRRQALAEASKARMILEKLSEKEKADYRKAEDRAEQRMFDELAIREFNISKREEKFAL